MFILHWALQVMSPVYIDVAQRTGEVLAQGPGLRGWPGRSEELPRGELSTQGANAQESGCSGSAAESSAKRRPGADCWTYQGGGHG